MRTPVTDLLGIEFPILAFSHCRDVVAAVTNAGGMGVLGGVAHTPEQLDIDLTWIEEQTKGGPFGVDLLLPAKYTGSDQGGLDRDTLASLLPPAQTEFLDELLERYGVPPLPDSERGPRRNGMSVDPQGYEPLLDVAFAHRLGLFASALGAPPAPVVERSQGGRRPGGCAGRHRRPRRSAPGGRCRPDRRPGHRGRRPHRRDRHDGARARGGRRGGRHAGARCRRHRPRSSDRRRAGPRRRRACGAARCGSPPRRPRPTPS